MGMALRRMLTKVVIGVEDALLQCFLSICSSTRLIFYILISSFLRGPFCALLYLKHMKSKVLYL